MAKRQADLFKDNLPPQPDGFIYRANLITESEERDLVSFVKTLPFKEFQYQGFIGKRRVVSFGWRYDFNVRELQPAQELPVELQELRERAARFSGGDWKDWRQALITEYQPGSTIGWHKDRPEFGDVIGVSLLSPCTFRFRRRRGPGWERTSLIVEPRSAYLLSGAAREAWQHSIPAVDRLRYSITFRKLAVAK
jgi:alkylated DNA repair dioxygenase AlkB